MSQEARVLKTAIGRSKYTEPLFAGTIASPWLKLAFEPFKTINRAFAPMAREQAFEASELAIATFLQAKAWGKPIVLLPVVLAARFQEAALLCLKGSPLVGPGDLRGKRVGVRAYSQTTGMWLRGILEDAYGVKPQDVRWLTFEGAHVAEYSDPPGVERAAEGQDLMALLRAGDLDAVIVGNDVPEGDDLRQLFPDAKAAGEAFVARHGFVPVNHLLTVRSDVAAREPRVVEELLRLFAELKAASPGESLDVRPMGRAAIDPVITLAVRYCVSQGLLPRPLSLDEVWAG
jgi:4,5-dihydroxyphthalate decarboxylase